MRVALITTVLRWGNERELDARARALPLDWLSDRRSLDPAVAPSILNGAAAKADSELFHSLRTAADNLEDVNERSTAIIGLGNVLEPALARQALDWVLATKRTGYDLLPVLGILGRSPETAPVLFDFTKQNYDQLVSKLPRLESMDPGTLTIQMLTGLCTAEARNEFEAFFSERAKALSGGPRFLEQTLEKIDQCVARRTAQEPEMTRYLKARYRVTN